jgi:hypothetical protein
MNRSARFVAFTRLAALTASVALAAIAMSTGTASAALPDNRAYEMVSPVEKGGYSVLPGLAIADATGDHVVVDGGARNALLSNNASWMLESRTPTGWSGVQVGPPPTANASFQDQRAVAINAVSEDFSSFAFSVRMPLDPRDTLHGMSEYLRIGPTGPLTWATGPPAPNAPVTEPGECEGGVEPDTCTTNRAVFAGASANLQDVVWSEAHPLLAPPAALPEYPADTHGHGFEVYESVAGHDQLVGLVPSAASEHECGPDAGSCRVPACGAAMGNYGGSELPDPFVRSFVAGHGCAPVAGAVSHDGSQVVFTSPDPFPYREGTPGCAAPELYIREDGKKTVQVSFSHRVGGDPRGPQEKVYAGSSEEDGRLNTVFFTSKEELTEDANTGPAGEGKDLYAYTLASGSTPPKLTDLTPENNTPGPGEAAELTYLGAATSGRFVYFTASSVLTPEPNSRGQAATPGASNLYVYDASTGVTRFIAPGAGLAPLHMGLQYANGETESRLTSELTPDGQHFLFVSQERVTAYDNFGPTCNSLNTNEGPVHSPGPCDEVYLYTPATGALTCVSCNPSGALPAGPARLPERMIEGFFDSRNEPGTLPLPRAISDDGSRIFFSSPDQLTEDAPPTKAHQPGGNIARTSEFEPNVYEYEHGAPQLIAPAALILTSTPSGDDVFINTLRQLTPQDDDDSADVFDARVGGGFPALASPACSGTSCQGVPAPPTFFASPPTTTFTGVGNVPPPGPRAGSKPTRAQLLAKALKRCRLKYSHRTLRRSCEQRAKRQYGAVKKAPKVHTKAKRGV